MCFLAGEGHCLGREGESDTGGSGGSSGLGPIAAHRVSAVGVVEVELGELGGPQHPIADAHTDHAGTHHRSPTHDIEPGQAGREHRRRRSKHAGGFALLDDAPLPHDDHEGGEGQDFGNVVGDQQRRDTRARQALA